MPVHYIATSLTLRSSLDIRLQNERGISLNTFSTHENETSGNLGVANHQYAKPMPDVIGIEPVCELVFVSITHFSISVRRLNCFT